MKQAAILSFKGGLRNGEHHETFIDRTFSTPERFVERLKVQHVPAGPWDDDPNVVQFYNYEQYGRVECWQDFRDQTAHITAFYTGDVSPRDLRDYLNPDRP